MAQDKDALTTADEVRTESSESMDTIVELSVQERLLELRQARNHSGERYGALRGSRKDQYSIRINDQWRLCFRWADDGAYDVEIVDYH